MRCVDEPRSSLPSWSRPVLFAAVSVLAAGCSSEATRFAENPFSAKTAQRPSHEVTGSVAQRPRPAVQSQALPPPSASAPATRPAVSSTAGGSRGMASYQAPVAPAQEVTGSVPRTAAALPPPPQVSPNATAASRPASGWTWEGGTPVTVGPGDTPGTLSQRYGVPAAEIARANNLPDAAAIKPGQRLVIPRYDAALVTGSSMPRQTASAPPRPAPAISAPQATQTQVVHTIAPGETLMKLSRQYNKSLSEIARANNIPAHTQVKIGDRIVIPGAQAQRTAAAPQVQPQRPASVAAAPAPQPSPSTVVQQNWPPAPPRVAAVSSQPAPTARVATPVSHTPDEPKARADNTASTMPGFRWPVRGRVIAGFGPRPSGQQNDGINVAVPEGTPIKAAEDGVVAYAGNELKSYGNLVLIRHSNGYVTAYAHASEIMVKRDEPVKRGQVIAKAGQTGSVSAPQLHFEIRKGSAPVDPMPFLDRGGSS